MSSTGSDGARPVHFGSGWTAGGLVWGCGYAAVSMFGFHQIDGKFGDVWSNFAFATLLVSYATLASLVGFAGTMVLGHQLLSRVSRRRAFWFGAVAGALGSLAIFALGVRLASEGGVLVLIVPMAAGGLLGVCSLIVVSVMRREHEHGAA